MNKKSKLILIILGLVLATTVIALTFGPVHFKLFSPKGVIAAQQRALLITFVLIMLVIVVPAVIATYVIAFRYRATNPTASYEPTKTGSFGIIALWWFLPTAIIAILSVLTWRHAHTLDPYTPIPSSTDPIRIQVIALQWKWLFIYPKQHIATVNFVEFPEKTPIQFSLTADGLMNSFWIPELGGQMYAMAGMETKLNLLANEPGEFAGLAAEINGDGYSGMKFTAKAVSPTEFESWVNHIKQTSQPLTAHASTELFKPTTDVPAAFYSATPEDLFTQTIHKFMTPTSTTEHYRMHMEGMH